MDLLIFIGETTRTGSVLFGAICPVGSLKINARSPALLEAESIGRVVGVMSGIWGAGSKTKEISMKNMGVNSQIENL